MKQQRTKRLMKISVIPSLLDDMFIETITDLKLSLITSIFDNMLSMIEAITNSSKSVTEAITDNLKSFSMLLVSY